MFRGFWDEDIVKGCKAALRQRYAQSGGTSPIDRVLLDMRACTVQAQAVMDGFAGIIEAYAAQISEYGILLPESTLLRLQMKRLLPPATPFFENMGEASTWLAA